MPEQSAYPATMETATQGRPPVRVLVPDRADAPVVERLASVLPGLVAALVLVGLGFADGGYFATAWGPATLVFLAVAALTLVLHPRPLIGLRSLALPALLGLFAVWALASSAWGSPSEAAQPVFLLVSFAHRAHAARTEGSANEDPGGRCRAGCRRISAVRSGIRGLPNRWGRTDERN